VSKELSGDDDADGMAALVLRAGIAAAVAIEPCHRVLATLLQLPADDIEC